ncbi:MAG: Aminoalkylphosphonate N-acetyltransferase [Nitrospira sp.]|nr:Aminoalkylphosphonate N-acetyltransferase [Nitrospira sp.]
MPDIIVRKAQKEDAGALIELYFQLDETTELATLAQAESAIEEISKQPMIHLLIAELDKQVVGTVTLVLVPNVYHAARPWAQVENVVVHDAHRRSGIGHALMARCEQITREADGYKLQLQSSHKRKEAHTFYQKEGYGPNKVGFTKYL